MSHEPRESCCFTCRRVDYLPVRCGSCGHGYCETHLKSHPCESRGVGAATGVGTKASSGPSYQQLASAVSTRHDGLAAEVGGSSKEHIKVRSVASAAAAGVDARGTSAIGIRVFAAVDKSAKQGSSVASKTKTLLLKQKALGEHGIAVENRVYALFNFPAPPQLSMCLFFSKHLTLGEVLHRIAQQYPVQCFSKAVRPDDKSLAIVGGEHIDLHSTVGEVLGSSGTDSVPSPTAAGALLEVDLQEISTRELVARLTRQEAERAAALLLQRTEAERAAVAAAGGGGGGGPDAGSSSESISRVDPAHVKVGDELMYVKAGANDLVRVITVHRDDFPNLYFTVALTDGSGREKQTVAEHLRHLGPDAADPSTDTAGVFSISVSYGGAVFSVRVLPSMTVAQLKSLCARPGRAGPAASSATSRLIFAGKVLKNDQRCAVLKAGAKLMLMGPS